MSAGFPYILGLNSSVVNTVLCGRIRFASKLESFGRLRALLAETLLQRWQPVLRNTGGSVALQARVERLLLSEG